MTIPGRLRLACGRAALVLAGVLLAVASAELLMRRIPQYRLERTGFECKEQPAEAWRPAPHVGYELVPHAYPTVNSFGMRDREYTLRKPSGVYRIAVIGDSLTDTSGWTALLEDRLNLRGSFEVLNFAVMGYNLYQYAELLEHKVMRFDPDLVLVAFCLNDIPGWFYSMTLRKPPGSERAYMYQCSFRIAGVTPENLDKAMSVQVRISPFLFRHSALYRFLVLTTLAPLGRPDTDPRAVPSLLLRKMVALSGGRIAGVVFPLLLPEAEYSDVQRGQYSLTKDVVGRSGIEWLDLHGVFAGRASDIAEYRRDPDDLLHFNGQADPLVAGEVADWLFREGILSTGGDPSGKR